MHFRSLVLIKNWKTLRRRLIRISKQPDLDSVKCRVGLDIYEMNQNQLGSEMLRKYVLVRFI